MSIQLVCDGCGRQIPDGESSFEEGFATPKTHFCEKCHKIWVDFEGEVRNRIVADSEAFEFWFLEKKGALKRDHEFLRLPDE